MYQEAVQAVRTLLARGERVCIVHQNITEFWCVATRPEGSANGLGMTIVAAHDEVLRICGLLTLLPETDSIYPEWLDLSHSAWGFRYRRVRRAPGGCDACLS